MSSRNSPNSPRSGSGGYSSRGGCPASQDGACPVTGYSTIEQSQRSAEEEYEDDRREFGPSQGFLRAMGRGSPERGGSPYQAERLADQRSEFAASYDFVNAMGGGGGGPAVAPYQAERLINQRTEFSPSYEFVSAMGGGGADDAGSPYQAERSVAQGPEFASSYDFLSAVGGPPSRTQVPTRVPVSSASRIPQSRIPTTGRTAPAPASAVCPAAVAAPPGGGRDSSAARSRLAVPTPRARHSVDPRDFRAAMGEQRGPARGAGSRHSLASQPSDAALAYAATIRREMARQRAEAAARPTARTATDWTAAADRKGGLPAARPSRVALAFHESRKRAAAEARAAAAARPAPRGPADWAPASARVGTTMAARPSTTSIQVAASRKSAMAAARAAASQRPVVRSRADFAPASSRHSNIEVRPSQTAIEQFARRKEAMAASRAAAAQRPARSRTPADFRPASERHSRIEVRPSTSALEMDARRKAAMAAARAAASARPTVRTPADFRPASERRSSIEVRPSTSALEMDARRKAAMAAARAAASARPTVRTPADFRPASERRSRIAVRPSTSALELDARRKAVMAATRAAAAARPTVRTATDWRPASERQSRIEVRPSASAVELEAKRKAVMAASRAAAAARPRVRTATDWRPASERRSIVTQARPSATALEIAQTRKSVAEAARAAAAALDLEHAPAIEQPAASRHSLKIRPSASAVSIARVHARAAKMAREAAAEADVEITAAIVQPASARYGTKVKPSQPALSVASVRKAAAEASRAALQASRSRPQVTVPVDPRRLSTPARPSMPDNRVDYLRAIGVPDDQIQYKPRTPGASPARSRPSMTAADAMAIAVRPSSSPRIPIGSGIPMAAPAARRPAVTSDGRRIPAPLPDDYQPSPPRQPMTRATGAVAKPSRLGVRTLSAAPAVQGGARGISVVPMPAAPAAPPSPRPQVTTDGRRMPAPLDDFEPSPPRQLMTRATGAVAKPGRRGVRTADSALTVEPARATIAGPSDRSRSPGDKCTGTICTGTKASPSMGTKTELAKQSTKAVEVKQTRDGVQKVTKKVTRVVPAPQGLPKGIHHLPPVAPGEDSIIQVEPTVDLASPYTGGRHYPRSGSPPKSPLGDPVPKSQLGKKVEKDLLYRARRTPDSIVTATGAKETMVPLPKIKINDVTVEPAAQFISEKVVERSPGIEKVSRTLIGVEPVRPGVGRKIELQLQQIEQSPPPHPSAPPRKVVSVRNIVSLSPTGDQAQDTVVTYETTQLTDNFGLTPAEVQRMVVEETQDVKKSLKWKPIELLASTHTSFPLKRKEHDYTLTKDSIKELQKAIKLPEPSPDEAPNDELLPELIATIMHAEENGIDMMADPKTICTYLFPGGGELGPEIMEVSSAAPAPLQDVAVPSQTLPEEFYQNSMNPELERVIMEAGHGREPSAAGFSEFQDSRQGGAAGGGPSDEPPQDVVDKIRKRLAPKKQRSQQPVPTLADEQPPWDSDDERSRSRGQDDGRDKEKSRIEQSIMNLVGALPSYETHQDTPIDSFSHGLANADAMDYLLHIEPPVYRSKFQLRGSSNPPWFPGFYVAFPEIPEIITVVKNPTIALRAAWKNTQPKAFPDDSLVVI